MERRIFGLENEYGITCVFEGKRQASTTEVARYIFRQVEARYGSYNVFAKNGARIYLDAGDHPEYATPECDALVDLVTHDRAGDRIVEGLSIAAEKAMRRHGARGEIFVYKNNVDSKGNSYGTHENYLVPRILEFSRLSSVLIPLLITRQLVAGRVGW